MQLYLKNLQDNNFHYHNLHNYLHYWIQDMDNIFQQDLEDIVIMMLFLYLDYMFPLDMGYKNLIRLDNNFQLGSYSLSQNTIKGLSNKGPVIIAQDKNGNSW